MHHITEIPVRGFHIDVYGHVNHTRYLEMMEEARWRFFDDRLGPDTRAKEAMPVVVVSITIHYRASAKLYDTLVIDTSTKSIGNTSAVVRQRITLKGSDTEVVDAEVTFVALDPKSGKPTPIAGQLHDLLEAAK